MFLTFTLYFVEVVKGVLSLLSFKLKKITQFEVLQLTSELGT